MKFDLVLLTRIFVGSLLGCVIGWEREARGSAVGDRTFGLVSLGAAASDHDAERRERKGRAARRQRREQLGGVMLEKLAELFDEDRSANTPRPEPPRGLA